MIVGMLLVYAALIFLLVFQAKLCKKGQWNDECFGLQQTKLLQGFMAVCIMFHHMGQKTCAPWHDPEVIVHGLDPFVNIGYFFVGVFLFCTGMGLYKSYKSKPGYLDGFVKRRILPIVIAFYASEWICTLARMIMGEEMDALQVVFYVTGLQLGNPNAWYVIALPFFYLFFYLAFRFCKKEWKAVVMTALGIFCYVLLGTIVDHNSFWLRGEWWYNTAHFFPLGILFAKHETAVVAHVKRHYRLYLVSAFIGMFVFYEISGIAQMIWSYYGENFGADFKVLRRWGCLFTQMLASCSFVCFVFLVTMKVKIGNAALKFMSGITLEFYLIHGIFVELFGYDFMETTESLVYIRNVPLYVLAVAVCSVPAALLFQKLLRAVTPHGGKKQVEGGS